MSRKLTVDVKHIDPRNGDQFGFEIINNGIPLTFATNSIVTSSYTKTFVQPTNQILNTGKIANISSTYSVVNNLQTFNGNVYDMTTLTDDKIVIVGDFTQYGSTVSERIIILNTDYSVFRSYPLGTGANSIIRTVVRGSGNVLYLGGDFTTFNLVNTNRIAKLNTGNNLDLSFTTNIMSASSNKGFNNTINDIILIAGNIYITGLFNIFNNNTRLGLISLTTSGNINNTFNVGTGLIGGSGNVMRAIDSNSVIILGGSFTQYKTSTVNRLVRIDLSGNITSNSIGTGFSSGVVYSIGIDSINNLYIGGTFTQYKGEVANKIIKTNTFGNRLVFGAELNGEVLDIEVLDNGKISLVGLFTEIDSTIFIGETPLPPTTDTVYNNVLCNSDGTFDKTININDRIRTVLEPTSNNLLFGGDFTQTTIEGTAEQTLLTIPIAEDLVVDFKGFSGGNVLSVIETSDDSFLIGGNFTSYNGNTTNRITKLTATGSIDSSFNIGTGFNNNVYSTIETTDNSYLLVGNFTSYNGDTRNRIVKLSATGSIDTSFNIGTGFNNQVLSVMETSDNGYLIGGNFTSYNGVTASKIIKLTATGSIDTSFNIGTGITFITDGEPIPEIQVYVIETIETSDNSYLLVGSFNSYDGVTASRIVKLNLDGSVNTSFNTELSSAGFSVVETSDNGYLVGGFFSTCNGLPSDRIVKLNIDGSIDSSFIVGDGFLNLTIPESVNIASVNTIIKTSDNCYLLGGNFTSYDSEDSNRIIKLNLDGSINTSFNIGTGFNATLHSLIEKNKRYLVGGDFTTYNGLTRNRIVYLNSDGSIVDEIFNLEGTVQNTYDNFELFHNIAGITHSIIGDVVRMEYTFNDDEVVINDVYDTPGYVELSYTNESLLITDFIDQVVVRSPHFIKTDVEDFDTVNFDIKVWEGLVFDGDSQPTLYSKTKQKIIQAQEQIYINVSNLCRERLEASATNFLDGELISAKPLSDNLSKWVQVDYTTYLLGATVSTYIKRLYVMDGYLDPLQEQEVPKVLITNGKRYINRNQTQRVYFQANRLLRAFYAPDGAGAQSLNWNIDIFNNKNYVQSVKVDTNAERFVTYFFVYQDLDGGEFTRSITFYIYDECRYNINSLVFKNKWGVLESLPVTKKIIEKLDRKNTDMLRSIVDFNGNYDITRHTNKQFNVYGETEYTVNTDFLPEYMNVPVKEMFLSEEVWLLSQDNILVPIILDSSSQVFKTSNNDGMIQYSFTIKTSHQEVKNII